MCLSIPAKIESIEENMATVDINGVKVHVSLQLVEDATVGDYVLVHTGYALQILTFDEIEDASKNLKLLNDEGRS